jgi:hypothetical protein
MFAKSPVWQQLAAVWLLALAVNSPAFADTLSGPALAAALRQGGYILYFRHGPTQTGEDDGPLFRKAAFTEVVQPIADFDDCKTQRNLSNGGRAQAKLLGEVIAGFHFPIGDVLASPYCRTMETAQLMFGWAERTMDARGGLGSGPERYGALRRRLSEIPPPGLNTVIVSHFDSFIGVTTTSQPELAELEAAIFRPNGNGFELVGRVRADAWKSLK